MTMAAINIHGIKPTNDQIKNANPIEQVWPRFKSYCEALLEGSKVGALVAWGGKSCDIKWIFRVVEETHKGKLFMPVGLKYFMDPCQVIKHYTSCKLNDQHRPETVGNGLATLHHRE